MGAVAHPGSAGRVIRMSQMNKHLCEARLQRPKVARMLHWNAAPTPPALFHSKIEPKTEFAISTALQK